MWRDGEIEGSRVGKKAINRGRKREEQNKSKRVRWGKIGMLDEERRKSQRK